MRDLETVNEPESWILAVKSDLYYEVNLTAKRVYDQNVSSVSSDPVSQLKLIKEFMVIVGFVEQLMKTLYICDEAVEEPKNIGK